MKNLQSMYIRVPMTSNQYQLALDNNSREGFKMNLNGVALQSN